MRNLILIILMLGISNIAFAEKFGLKEIEEKNLKSFVDLNFKLFKASEQLKLMYMSYGDKPKDISKSAFLDNNIRELLIKQHNRTITLYWSLSLALDIEKKDKLKIANALGAICTAPSATFDTRRNFKPWQELTIEAAKEEGFNKAELVVIRNALDIYVKSLESTQDLCSRVVSVENW